MDYMTMNFNRNGGSGTSDYSQLTNKPSINDVELSGNKTASDLGLMPEYDIDERPTEDSDNLISSKAVWEADKNINNKLQGSKTATGNPITITDAEPMNAESVVVELEPKQDLHGYDSPWVGGAGKNKLPLVLSDIKSANTSGTWSGNTYTLNGVTFEVLTDSAGNVEGIKVNGTSSATTTLKLIDDVKTALSVGTTIIINGCPSNGSRSTFYIQANNIGYDTGSGVSGSVPSTTSPFLIVVENNVEIDTTFYPMIRLSTETDATFEPYSNISPISGYSEVNVENNSNTYTIDFGGTKYGGILNVTEGVLMVDRVVVEYDGSVDETWDGNNDIHGISIPSDYQIEQTPISDAFRGVSPRAYTQVNVGEVALNPSYTNINLRYIENGLSTWTNYLSNNPLRICYKLATPLTIQLTPTDIALLENTNNISTDGTNIQLKYQPNNVIGECKGYTDEQIEKHNPLNYSTDEKAVGTWIDGKTIWQKTIDFGQSVSITSGDSIKTRLGDLYDIIEQFISAFGVATNIKACQPFYIEKSNNDAKIWLTVNAENVTITHLTIQYTKV